MKQTALITGASKRIGKAIALYLAENGWNIAVHYNSSYPEAEELVTLLAIKYNSQIFRAFRADLKKPEEVESLVPSVLQAFGGIDLLINNASVFEPAYLKETSAAFFEHQIAVNLRAPFLLMRDYANLCHNGNIINFVDTRITSSKSDFAVYSLSKKALWELTRMAALEFAPAIRVNAIAPGVTLAPEGKGEKYLTELAEKTPMKKPGGVEPVIRSLNFILENDHLTGQLIFADGGENLGQNA